MDFYIATVITELGLHDKIPPIFPTAEQMTFIESIMGQKNMNEALQACPEETSDFEQNALGNCISAMNFFGKLRNVSERGSYQSASMRMDVQVATRVLDEAPDCKINMHLKTSDWEKTMNLAPPTVDKLLAELLNARSLIRKNKVNPNLQID